MPVPHSPETLELYRSAFSKGTVGTLQKLVTEGFDLNEILDDAKHGFNGNAFHVFGAFHHTTFGEGDVAVASYLKAMDVDVNALNTRGETPLMMAVQVQDLKDAALGIIRTLIQHGGDIHARDGEGRTLLHLAARADNWNAYKMLEDMGLDNSIRDAEGNYAFEFWKKVAPASIAHTELQQDGNYRITRTFNFKAGVYTCVTQNLATKVEAVTEMPLSVMDATELGAAARSALEKRGGVTSAMGKVPAQKGIRL